MKKIFLLFALIIFVISTSVITLKACPTISFSQTNVDCNGSCNGEIVSTVTGGAPGYTYSWSNGETTSTISNLCAGTYILCVTDNNGCVTCDTTIITEPSPIVITGTVTNISCNGLCDAEITAYVTGGTGGPYAYVWSNGGNAPAVTGICAGVYTLCVTDVNGCTACDSFVISNPTQVVITGTVTNVSCYGACDGSIQITGVSGGTPGYTYLWSTGEVTPYIQNLCAGTYSLCITDSNGCITCESYGITEPPALTLVMSSTMSSCGNADGSAAVSISGGTPGYTYLWSPGGATTDTVNNISAGFHSVLVTDAIGCTASVYVAVSDSGGPSVVIYSITNVSCNGACDGEMIVAGSLGMPVIIVNVCAGTYNMCTDDVNGCISCETAIITEPPPIAITLTVTNASCYGTCDGSATASASGGTGSFTYTWNTSPVQTTPTAANLCAGNHTVCVTDSNNCIVCETFTITSPSQITATAAITNTSCYGACDGIIQITGVSGGSGGGYSYFWSPSGETTPYIQNACTGSYTLCITDSNGCTACENFTVSSPPPLVITGTVTNTSCFAACDGEIATSVTGGTGAYAYIWSHGQSPTGLCADIYTLCVTDGNGCMVCENFTVSQPAPVIPVINAIGDSVYSTVAFTYQWYLNTNPITGATNQGHEATQAGYYWVTVTDVNGCTGSSDSIFIDPVKITEIADNSGSFRLFPIPAGEQAFLEFDLPARQQLSINVYDITGKLASPVYAGTIESSQKKLFINTASLSNGVFILRIEGGEINKNLKLVVKK